MDGALPNDVRPRVHAIILTKDRTEQLRRCVETALSTLASCDILTVLDDSSEDGAPGNLALLREVAKRSSTPVTYLEANEAHVAAVRTSGNERAPWQVKSAARDIAPLRNLSLLLSVAASARTTVLVDDDITDFDILATHLFIESQVRGVGGIVTGVAIGGWSEMDMVTRLNEAMRRLCDSLSTQWWNAAELFRVKLGDDVRLSADRQWVSAGYMAFSIPTPRLLAFPPGYNEDWLWCLLQRVDQGTRIVQSGNTVSHEPPSLRQPTREDIRFELAGDLILDAFVEWQFAQRRNGKSALVHLRGHTPDRSLLPSTRVAETVHRAGRIKQICRLHSDLKHGVGLLEEMARDGELDVDEKRALSTWCLDAEIKQKTFKRSFDDMATVPALREFMRMRRL